MWERVSDCCLTPQLYSNTMARTRYIQWNDGDIRFIIDLQAQLDLYNASSLLQQQSACRQVAPLGHILLIQSQLVFALTP